ncbi:hypothetical protein BDF14DRAFT_1723092, partial [Spinellus fusiger]
IRVLISNLMYAQTIEIFDSAWEKFKSECEEQFPIFFNYFKKMSFERKDFWSKAWRPAASFHTNSMIESYHNQLKSFYLTRPRNKRVDRVVYTLSKLVVCDYRTEHAQVELGIREMRLIIAEMARRKVAESIDTTTAHSMVRLDPLSENVVNIDNKLMFFI